jgi:hydroxymethylpyrimidine/phosphomethylpyrimidine kinase
MAGVRSSRNCCRARVATPNIAEAEVLCGHAIASLDDARDAARRIRDVGARAVVVTGGHGDGFGDATQVVDLVLEGHDFHECRVPRVDAGPTHGTGCTFASALAARLALGDTLPDAAAHAQRYVAGALAHRLVVGKGRAVLDHFWAVRGVRL